MLSKITRHTRSYKSTILNRINTAIDRQASQLQWA